MAHFGSRCRKLPVGYRPSSRRSVDRPGNPETGRFTDLQQSHFSMSDGPFRENAIGNTFRENGSTGRHRETEPVLAIQLHLPNWEGSRLCYQARMAHRVSDRALGFALRRWRLMHRVKQAHAAERLGVAQSTISRWEAGLQAMSAAERCAIERIVAARLDNAADRVLAGLVTDAPRAVHLICDHNHRLLAFSASRAHEFGIDAHALLGTSLLRFATDDLAAADVRLDEYGWYDQAMPEPLVIDTGHNQSRVVPIRRSRCRWTRFILSDGAAVRLVETLDAAPPPPATLANRRSDQAA